MTTKLTLSMDDALISRIKGYAEKQQTTVSELTRRIYLQLLPNESTRLSDQTLGPVSQQLSELPPLSIPDSMDDRAAYHAHWDKKYG